MPDRKKTKRVCKNGHTFFKSSDCPVCPVCEKNRAVGSEFLTLFAAPARRALESATINQITDLAKFTHQEIMSLHGFGKSGMATLNKVMAENKISFKK